MAKDLLMFVGKTFYPTIEDYIKEALSLGCCKKVPKIPLDITIGESKVYLLQREAPVSVLFGYFTIDGIIKCSLQQQLYDEIKVMGDIELVIPALRQEHRDQMPMRGCGGIDPPTYYLVSPQDISAQKGWRKSPTGEDTEPIHIFNVWTELDIPHFKGFKYVKA